MAAKLTCMVSTMNRGEWITAYFIIKFVTTNTTISTRKKMIPDSLDKHG